MKEVIASPYTPSVLTGLVIVLFIVRGYKVFKRAPLEKYVIALLCLSIGFFMLPETIPASIPKYIGLIVINFLFLSLLIDFFLQFMLFLKRKLFSGERLIKKTPDYLKEIYTALEKLSKEHTGALILIEKKDDLKRAVNTGIEYEAQIRSEILIAFFEKTSPVHDGAVVVRDGRVCMVKAILPMRTKAKLPMGVGTRHRAAIGITERTDCIALVVSEERGEMSVFYGGARVEITIAVEFYAFVKKILADKKKAILQ